MQNSSDESRREAVAARLNAARESYERCLSDVTVETANRSSEWSVADLLRHVSPELFLSLVVRVLNEDAPQLDGVDRQTAWQRLVEANLANIDEAIDIATTITPEQMTRTGERRGQPYSPLDGLEACATHLESHLTQLRDEIRPREGLPPV